MILMVVIEILILIIVVIYENKHEERRIRRISSFSADEMRDFIEVLNRIDNESIEAPFGHKGRTE